MKVCVVGVGAIGGLFAGWLGTRLPHGEIELSALARGATLEALRRDGLRLESAGEHVRIALRASDRPAELGPQDLVIVAVKGPALARAAPSIAALLSANGVALLAMNGVPWWFFDGLPGPAAGLQLQSVDPQGAVRAALPAGQVVGCVVHASSQAVEPGAVRHLAGNGLIIGEPHGGHSERLQRLAGLLARAGFAVTVSEFIQRDIWYKLWGNMSLNPLSALTGASADRILDDPLLLAFCDALMLEAAQVGERIGCRIEQTPQQRHRITRRLGAFKTSMLQDAEAGRPLEIDALLGAVREIGQHVGVATPNVDALLGMVRVMARTRGLA